MRLSSYVDGDRATVRATEREEEVFAGDPLGSPFSPLTLHSAAAVAPPDGAMCIFTDGPIRPPRRLRIVGLSRGTVLRYSSSPFLFSPSPLFPLANVLGQGSKIFTNAPR